MPTDPQAGPDAEGAPDDAVPMYALGRVGRAHSLDGSFAVTKPKGEHLVRGAVVTVAVGGVVGIS